MVIKVTFVYCMRARKQNNYRKFLARMLLRLVRSKTILMIKMFTSSTLPTSSFNRFKCKFVHLHGVQCPQPPKLELVVPLRMSFEPIKTGAPKLKTATTSFFTHHPELFAPYRRTVETPPTFQIQT